MNQKAKVVVHGLLSMGSVIRVADAKVRLKQAVIAVQITTKKRKGSFIHAIEEADLEHLNLEREAILRGEPIPEFNEPMETDSEDGDEGESDQQAS